jgi:hypothetical protein
MKGRSALATNYIYSNLPGGVRTFFHVSVHVEDRRAGRSVSTFFCCAEENDSQGLLTSHSQKLTERPWSAKGIDMKKRNILLQVFAVAAVIFGSQAELNATPVPVTVQATAVTGGRLKYQVTNQSNMTAAPPCHAVPLASNFLLVMSIRQCVPDRPGRPTPFKTRQAKCTVQAIHGAFDRIERFVHSDCLSTPLSAKHKQ